MVLYYEQAGADLALGMEVQLNSNFLSFKHDLDWIAHVKKGRTPEQNTVKKQSEQVRVPHQQKESVQLRLDLHATAAQ